MYCQGFGTFKCCKPNINFNNCFAKPLSNMNIWHDNPLIGIHLWVYQKTLKKCYRNNIHESYNLETKQIFNHNEYIIIMG